MSADFNVTRPALIVTIPVICMSFSDNVFTMECSFSVVQFRHQ